MTLKFLAKLSQALFVYIWVNTRLFYILLY